MLRIKKIAAFAVGVAAFSFAGSTLAAVALPIGWYVEADGGYSRISNKSYGNGTSTSVNGFGWGGNVGYKFMPYLAGEVGYIKYADVKVKNSAGTQFQKDVHQQFDIAAKGILPITDTGLELFAKLGASRLGSHTVVTNAAAASTVTSPATAGSRNVIGLFMGVGADYAFMPYLQGIIQWNRAKGNSSTGNADLYSVGLSYIFS